MKLETKAIAVELNRITKIKIDVGSLAPIDVVQTEVNIATAEQDIINAEAAIGLAQDQLQAAAQLSTRPTGAPDPIVPTDPVRVEQQQFDLDAGHADGAGAAAGDHGRSTTPSALEQDPLRLLEEPDPAAALNLVRPSYGNNGLDGLQLDHPPPTGPSSTGRRLPAARRDQRLRPETSRTGRVGLVVLVSDPQSGGRGRAGRGAVQPRDLEGAR